MDWTVSTRFIYWQQFALVVTDIFLEFFEFSAIHADSSFSPVFLQLVFHLRGSIESLPTAKSEVEWILARLIALPCEKLRTQFVLDGNSYFYACFFASNFTS